MIFRVLITMIIFAVVVQNTCPHGWAAKTAFVSCQTLHCPMKEHNSEKAKDQADAGKGVTNVKQSFVLHIVRPENPFQVLVHMEHSVPVDHPGLKELFSDPLFRPPIASFLS